MKLTAEDRAKLLELQGMMLDIMGKYQEGVGPNDPVGQAKFRVADGVLHFQKATG